MRLGRVTAVAIVVLLGAACVFGPPQTRSQSVSSQPPSQSTTQPAAPPAKPKKPQREHYERKSLVNVTDARRVNVAQLEEALRESRGRNDKTVAKQLAQLGLTQRFSLQRVLAWEPLLPGTRSRQVLALLTDASAFLPLPDTDVPALPQPALAEQRQIISRAVSYVNVDLSHLPNFFATRTTDRFEAFEQQGRSSQNQPIWSHLDTSRETVLYQDQHETTHAKSHGAGVPRDAAQMDVSGTFGPILLTVFRDAAHGSVEWDHWEQGSRGPVAVFRFRIAKAYSHYDITFESLTDARLRRILQHQPTAYHGEITVDPSSGAILRLTLEADFDPSSPIRRSDIVVDYGPISIAGKDYICPVHSVAISRGKTIVDGPDGEAEGYGTEISSLNEMTYTDYHVFRSTSRILTGNPSEPNPH